MDKYIKYLHVYLISMKESLFYTIIKFVYNVNNLVSCVYLIFMFENFMFT